MSRRTRITAIVFGTFVFLGISVMLAKAMASAGHERAKVLEVLRAQARGDLDGMLARLPACRAEPACVATLRARLPRLRRPGDVDVLNYQPSVRLALTRRLGTARVAWKGSAGLPVVQCVKVRRDGPLTGGDVELLALSAPIGRESACR